MCVPPLMHSKLLLTLSLATGLVTAAQAQVFGPETSRNMLLGGIVGAIIGENNHHQAATGAVLGATAGYIWSQATAADSQTQVCRPAPRPVVVTAVERPCPPPPPVIVVRRSPPPVEVVYVPERPPHRHGHYEKVIVMRHDGCREVRYVFVEDRRRECRRD